MEEFFSELRASPDGEMIDFCRQKILHGLPQVFLGKERDYYFFRKRIADHFNIHFHEIIVVGSAKLGFSPTKKTQFDLESDIDVAIISSRLYEEVLDQLLEFQFDLRASRRSVSAEELKKYHSFLEYTAMGWIRPDRLPMAFKMGELRRSWFDFFSSISYGNSEVGNYKVSAGVWKSYKHIERYTMAMIIGVRSAEQVEAARGQSD